MKDSLEYALKSAYPIMTSTEYEGLLETQDRRASAYESMSAKPSMPSSTCEFLNDYLFMGGPWDGKVIDLGPATPRSHFAITHIERDMSYTVYQYTYEGNNVYNLRGDYKHA